MLKICKKLTKIFLLSAIVSAVLLFAACGNINKSDNGNSVKAIYSDPVYSTVLTGESIKVDFTKESFRGDVSQIPLSELELIFEDEDISDVEITRDYELVFKKPKKYKIRVKRKDDRSILGAFSISAYSDESYSSGEPIDFESLSDAEINKGEIRLLSLENESQKQKAGEENKQTPDNDSSYGNDLEKRNSKIPSPDERGRGQDKANKNQNDFSENTEQKFSRQNVEKAEKTYEYLKAAGFKEYSFEVKISVADYYKKGEEYYTLDFTLMPAVKILREGQNTGDNKTMYIIVKDEANGCCRNIYFNINNSLFFYNSSYAAILNSENGIPWNEKLTIAEYERLRKEEPEYFEKKEELKFLFSAKEQGRYEIILDAFMNTDNSKKFFSARRLADLYNTEKPA